MRLRAFASTTLFSLFLLISITAISVADETVSKLEKALQSSGDNRTELENVLVHYSGKGLEDKYAAAVFLIENMEGHSYVTYVFQDTAGQEVPFDALAYPDFDSLLAAVKIIEDGRGELDYQRDEMTEDLTTIKAEFLINHIDYAFKAWREKPWAGFLTFEQFCEYVLPYRGSNEPLEPWRQFFWDQQADLPATMTDSTDPLEAASLINEDIMSWFTFDPRYYFHPTDQGLNEMRQNKMGRCEDMTNLTIYAMRANGLAVTSDYTPFWANSGNNHAWNSILTPNGKVIPFMGAEKNPGSYKLANKLAKVYRKTFSNQHNNLIFRTRKQDKVAPWLAGKNYIDVTSDYTDVSNVPIHFTQAMPDSVDIAYVCVFNSGEWQAIHWARIKDGTALFTDMGCDIAYLPALYLNKEIVPFGPAFILTEDAAINLLLPQATKTSTVTLTSTTGRKRKVSTDGIIESSLTLEETYELHYWNDGWQLHGEATTTEGPLEFTDVPAGTLYWLVAKDSDGEERIFTIENGQQVWW